MLSPPCFSDKRYQVHVTYVHLHQQWHKGMQCSYFFSSRQKRRRKTDIFSCNSGHRQSQLHCSNVVHSFFFLFFFANNQNTPSRHCHNRNQRAKQRCVGSGDEEKKKKKVMTKKIQMPTLLISLSTLNHMTSSGKPTSYTCKRAHLISFRR